MYLCSGNRVASLLVLLLSSSECAAMYMLVSFALARSHCAARGARTLPINSWKTVDRRFSSTARSHRAFSSSSRASQAHATPNPIPAAFLRGGTSKGVFINAKHLPSDRNEWDSIFLGIMGSPDAQYGRQLNGMGGGVSSLSKICVVGPASDEHRSLGADAQYTFCQVSRFHAIPAQSDAYS